MSSVEEGVLPACYHIPKLNHPVFDKIWSAYTEQVPSITVELKGDEKKKWDLLFFKETELHKLPPKVKEAILAGPKGVFSIVSMRYGLLSAMDAYPIPEDMIKILGRFAKVFEQTYTRFLDLQKAEAQARESEIELALERVRARTMAMQKSEELQDVANTIYERLHELKVEIDFANLVSMIEGSRDYYVWANGLSKPICIPFNDFTEVQRIYNDLFERRVEFFTHTFSGEMRDEYYRFLLEQTNLGMTLPEEQKKHFWESPFNTASLAFTKNTGIQLVRLSDKAFSKEENDILIRFVKVFEQAYTRFLDLQKAEAQARESQIQLAMERVRARTMAMQRSEELPDAALLLYNQVKELGVQLFGTSFQLWEEDRKEVTVWACIKDFMIPPLKVPTREDPLMIHILEAAEKGETLYVEELGGEALENHNRYMMSIPAFRAGVESLAGQGIVLPVFDVFHAAYFANGFILFISPMPCPEAHDIFKRFAKVFEQTYTRFLDLQKAEAQAREAQIEAALERVRSRSMGMQKTEELAQVTLVINEQMRLLNPTAFYSAGILANYNESDDFSFWIALSNQLFLDKRTIPYFDHPIFHHFIDQKKKGLDFYTHTLTFEEKNQWVNHAIPEDMIKILGRFAKVF